MKPDELKYCVECKYVTTDRVLADDISRCQHPRVAAVEVRCSVTGNPRRRFTFDLMEVTTLGDALPQYIVVDLPNNRSTNAHGQEHPLCRDVNLCGTCPLFEREAFIDVSPRSTKTG